MVNPEDNLSQNLKEFFQNKNFITVIDALAQRYHKLPHQILEESTIFEFSFDVAVMVTAEGSTGPRMAKSESEPGNTASDEVDWSKLGIKRTVREKPGK